MSSLRARDRLLGWSMDAPERLALLAILLSESEQTRFLRALLADGPDLAQLARLAEKTVVSASLYEALSAHDLLDELPPDVRESLRARHEQSRVQNLLLLKDLAAAQAALEEGGYRAIVLKGGALLATVFQTTLERHADDIDLYLPPEEVDAAEAFLRSRGYREMNAERVLYDGRRLVDREWRKVISHHDPYCLVGPWGTEIELHVAAFEARRQAEALPFDRVWARSRSVPTPFGPVRVPGPSDLVLHLCLHVLAHHGGDPRLRIRHLLDMNALDSGGALDRRELGLLARTHPEVRTSLRLLRGLRSAVRAGDRSKLARLSRSCGSSVSAADQIIHGVPVLARTVARDPRAGLRMLLPSRAFLAWKYGIPEDELPLARYRLYWLAGKKPEHRGGS